MHSKTLKIVTVAVIVVVAFAVAYVASTFPRAIADFSVAFSAGPDQSETGFEVPLLNDRVQVVIVLSANSTSWGALIENLDGGKLWEYSGPAQQNQTIYHSAWTPIPSGRYNFTFSTVGREPISAEIHIVSKGGFW